MYEKSARILDEDQPSVAMVAVNLGEGKLFLNFVDLQILMFSGVKCLVEKEMIAIRLKVHSASHPFHVPQALQIFFSNFFVVDCCLFAFVVLRRSVIEWIERLPLKR